MSLVLCLCHYHFLREISHRMPSTQVVKSQLTKDSINDIAENLPQSQSKYNQNDIKIRVMALTIILPLSTPLILLADNDL